jgi:hypothetical protein
MGRAVSDEDARYWKTELRNVEPEQLLRHHEASVAALGARRKLTPKRMTLEEVAATEVLHEKRLVGRSGRTGYFLILSCFVVPALFSYAWGFVAPALVAHATSGPRSWHHHSHFAWNICSAASLFALVRLVLLPLNRHYTVWRSHAEK